MQKSVETEKEREFKSQMIDLILKLISKECFFLVGMLYHQS
jgi:hypothetical protein